MMYFIIIDKPFLLMSFILLRSPNFNLLLSVFYSVIVVSTVLYVENIFILN